MFFMATTYWTIFMLLIFSHFFRSPLFINSNKTEFYGDMRNGKLWQMETKNLPPWYAMCWIAKGSSGMKWLYGCICSAINVRHEPWNMHNNPFHSFAPPSSSHPSLHNNFFMEETIISSFYILQLFLFISTFSNKLLRTQNKIIL